MAERHEKQAKMLAVRLSPHLLRLRLLRLLLPPAVWVKWTPNSDEKYCGDGWVMMGADLLLAKKSRKYMIR